jgi:hypothetical protein
MESKENKAREAAILAAQDQADKFVEDTVKIAGVARKESLVILERMLNRLDTLVDDLETTKPLTVAVVMFLISQELDNALSQLAMVAERAADLFEEGDND